MDGAAAENTPDGLHYSFQQQGFFFSKKIFPQNYPLTTRFYTQLFNGSLGYTKIAEFTSRPNLPIPGIHLCLTPPDTRYGEIAFSSQECPLPGISFVDDYSDETFTVYDHPNILIFKKI